MDQQVHAGGGHRVFVMPAYRVDLADELLRHAEEYARRYGRVELEINGRRLVVQAVERRRCTCVRCAEVAPVLFATSRSGKLCSDCTRQLIHLG